MGHNYGGIVSPRADVVKLGMVDSFICPEQHKEILSKLVYEAFVDVVGVSCVVK